MSAPIKIQLAQLSRTLETAALYARLGLVDRLHETVEKAQGQLNSVMEGLK